VEGAVTGDRLDVVSCRPRWSRVVQIPARHQFTRCSKSNVARNGVGGLAVVGVLVRFSTVRLVVRLLGDLTII
jgi:hypothetical protein